MAVSTTEEVICILTVVLFWAVYVPVCCVSMYQYRKELNELVIVNRRGSTSIVTCCFLSIMIVIMGCATLAHAEYIVFTLNFSWAFVHLGVYFSIFYRFYIIYFDFKWHYAMTLNDNWHQIINSSSESNDSSADMGDFEWFIRNRSKLGGMKKIQHAFVALWLIASTITTGLVMIEVIAVETDTFPQVFVAIGIILCFLLFVISPCLLIWKFYHKLTKFRKTVNIPDEFGIFSELTLIYYYSLAHFIILFALIFVIDDFFISNIKSSRYFGLRMLLFHLTGISNCLFVVLHTAYPLTSLKFDTFSKKSSGKSNSLPPSRPRSRSHSKSYGPGGPNMWPQNKVKSKHKAAKSKPSHTVVSSLGSIREDSNFNLTASKLDTELKDTGYHSDGGDSVFSATSAASPKVDNNNNLERSQREESLTRSVSNVYGQAPILVQRGPKFQHNKIKENFYQRERYLRKRDVSDLRHVLAHKDCMPYLVKFLCFELNLATLVALIEMTQFKLFIINHTSMYNENNEEKSLVKDTLLKFSNVPESSILYHWRDSKDFINLKKQNEEFVENNNNNGNENSLMQEIYELKIIAFVLYCKYVRKGGEYEVNLSDKRRLRFRRRYFPSFAYWITECKEFDSLTKIFHLFDQVESEMMVLLYFSWLRFKQSKQFIKVEPLLTNQSGDWELL